MKFVTDLSKGILGRPDSEELWNEINSYVPDEMLLKPDFRALVVACGHCTEAILLVKRMQSLGIPNSRIQDAIWVLDKYQVFTNQARCLGFKHVITSDFLSWDAKGMKFDLCLGNPPYQINIRNKIWVSFAEKAIGLLKPNGIIVFITPNAWKKNLGDYKKIYNLLSQNLIEMKDCNDSFPGIGEDIGYWIYSKDPAVPKIKVEFDESIIERIFNKVKKTGDFWHYRDFTSTTFEFSRTKNEIFSYPVYQTASQMVYVKPSEIKYFGWKVLINNSGYFPSSPNDTKYCMVSDSIGAGGGSFGIKVNSEQEGYNVLSWVTSKLYRCIVNKKKTSGFNQIFVSLTHLGADKMWTDAELYAHFNLTQEEIDYIEANVA